MLGEIRKLDEENAVKYSVYYDEYSDRECSVSVVSSEPPTTELIQRFSFNISTYVDQNRGPIAKIYVGGLYVNRKYHDVGSNLLSIAKSAIRYMVNIGGFNVGMIELYSVETAVLFYIKNEFVIKDLFWQVDPQSKVYATQRMIDFAMKESNINIMKKYATVTSENFLDFVKFLLEKTKYGKYFTAYFEALNNPDEIEKSVMQSRFISSIFNTNMVWLHIRDTSKPRVNLKPLTL